ncbi:hypothetical protein [Actinomadura formosensis]|uniref:hypothetical protein n=1 Tax=Actinomadura formosensis TaxID=60706 RepID=UPI000A7FD64B|nr:hypothetical protein [Actinomadura formosensis]
MAEFSLGPEFKRFQRDMQKQMCDFTEAQESIRATIRRGGAAGGRTVTECTAEDGVTKIDLAPGRCGGRSRSSARRSVPRSTVPPELPAQGP